MRGTRFMDSGMMVVCGHSTGVARRFGLGLEVQGAGS